MMKKAIIEFIGTIFTSLVIVPCVLIGMAVAGDIYGKKVEPWLNEKLNKSN